MEYVTREYLDMHYDLLQDIKVDMDRYNLIIGLAAVNNDGQPRGNGTGDPTFLQGLKREELYNSIKKKMDIANKENAEIEECIRLNDLTPNEKRVIRYKYIEGLEWEDIVRLVFGKKMDFKNKIRDYYNRAYNIHSSAMRKMVLQAASDK